MYYTHCFVGTRGPLETRHTIRHCFVLFKGTRAVHQKKNFCFFTIETMRSALRTLSPEKESILSPATLFDTDFAFRAPLPLPKYNSHHSGPLNQAITSSPTPHTCSTFSPSSPFSMSHLPLDRIFSPGNFVLRETPYVRFFVHSSKLLFSVSRSLRIFCLRFICKRGGRIRQIEFGGSTDSV